MNLRPYIYSVRPFFDSFWSQAPALFYGLFLYQAALFAFCNNIALLVPLIFLFICQSQIQKLRLLLGGFAAILFWVYVQSAVVMPPSWADSIPGVATFEITDMVHEMRYGRMYCKFKVNVTSFDAENKSFFAKNIPCRLVWNHPNTRLKADWIYQARATLHEFEGNWSIKIVKDTDLRKVCKIFSLVESRLWAKAQVKQLLAKFLHPSQTRAFLEGVLLGEFHDVHLAASLGRFGLQHITVVSGFHFSLIAVLLAAFFRLMFPWKMTNIFLLVGITGYLLFIGNSPSVLRAWIAVSVLFLGKVFERTSNGMNCLGLGLIVVLCWDPSCVTSLSFSLSFLATFAILLLYPLVDQSIRSLFPKRSASELIQMPFLEQVYFVLLRFFISSIALVTSVSILMLPMSLYCFGQFPLVGIIYNCFFPFLVSVAVVLVCLSLLFLWCTPVAAFLFSTAQFVLDCALTLITHAPTWCDVTIRASNISVFWLVVYLCIVSFLGIVLVEKRKVSTI